MNILDQYTTDRYTLINGDTTEAITMIPDNSIGLSVFSPPFSSLYTYSNSDRDFWGIVGMMKSSTRILSTLSVNCSESCGEDEL